VLAHLETGRINLLKECPSCGACYDASGAPARRTARSSKLSLPSSAPSDGKYRLDRMIGKGGMGAVYEAADRGLARPVAVKIMLAALRRSADAAAFEREAQAAARLTHPNMRHRFDYGGVGAGRRVHRHGAGQRTDAAGELEQHGRIAPRTVASWLRADLRGRPTAHERRIVHRDLKPEKRAGDTLTSRRRRRESARLRAGEK